MKYTSFLAASAITGLASSSAVIGRDAGVAEIDLALDVVRRASPQAPNGYAPSAVDCPSTRPTIRKAGSLSSQETEWLKKRRANTVEPMRELLTRVNITGFDAGAYIDKHSSNTSALPNIAISFSGGGYRALLNGAGALAAFDSRTTNATNEGHLGGLLQASTYVSALSGGGWLIGSIYANNFTTVQNIQQHDDIWQFQNSLLVGPPTWGIQLLSTADYYKNLLDTVNDKSNAQGEFNTSLTDYWGRALSFQLINATDGGPAYTFSSIQDDTDFSNGNAPMPILVADGRNPKELIISLNATVYEFNPWEMGSSDPTTYAFVPLKYIGSNFSNGVIPDDQKCIQGFDNLGFVMGTSSSLFNQIFLNLDTYTNGFPTFLTDVIADILVALGAESNDIADYTPNPFFGFNNGTNLNAQQERLTLVDGGEDLQNIPFNPVIQPNRNVDVIFAVDSSADTVEPASPNFPNGTALIATYQRANTAIMNRTSFPYVPDHNTFVALGLNNRPTFFGCDGNNVTEGGNIPPLIVYIPNAPYVFWSNTSTFDKLDYTIEERDSMIHNGYNVATQANSTREGASNWPTCVGCAILSRSLERNGETVPDVCKQCFTDYCWNGTTVSGSATYSPKMILTMDATAKDNGIGKLAIPSVVGCLVSIAVSASMLL